MGMRNIYISLVVFVCILFPAGILLQDSEAAVQAVVVVAFVACFTVLHTLDERQRRRERRNDRAAPTARS
jgi:preprotein translocase subunit SecG